MAQLFPTDYEDETSTVADIAQKTPVGFRSGILFDYSLGDFPRDGRHQILSCSGIESWKAWVVNCMATERYKYLAYSQSYGIETECIFSATSRSEAESILTRQITEALAADPYQRTQYVKTMSISWIQPDSVEVELVLHGQEDVTIDITTYISRGGA